MWEGAWAAAPRGIPACLGKHSWQGLAPHGHIAHIPAGLELPLFPLPSSNAPRVPGQGLRGNTGADLG